MRLPHRIGCAGALAVLLAAAPAHAYRFNEYVEVYGYAQVWLTLWEQMQKDSGLTQHPSGDSAADSLSGLSLNAARVGVKLTEPDWDLSLHAQVRLDHSPMLLDADVAWTPTRWFSLHLGQFKVPGAAEALTDDRELDFILRPDIVTALADYSLSKSPYAESILYGSSSYLRDLGLAVKGEVGDAWVTGRYFLMVGNGLGAGMYFGGLTSKQYFVTNKAQFYYGGRAEVQVAQIATLGVFGSYNQHLNIVYNSERTIYDIDRRMVGGDLQVAIPLTGLRLALLYGGGQVRDDFTGDGKTDLRYSGWAASASWDVFPVLRRITGWHLPGRHTLELGFRYDSTSNEMDESGNVVVARHYTAGISYNAAGYVKVQLNYVVRRTDDPLNPDLANNVLFVNVQAAF